MNVQEQVREALQRAGRERHVDVQALHDSTKAALASREARSARPSGWERWRPVAVAAAGAVAVIGGVVYLPGLDLVDLGGGPAVSPSEVVDDTFICPAQRDTRFGPRNRDDSFLPELTSDLKPAGEAAGAPRWESAPLAGGAILRLGNEDGTLASVVRFEEASNGFRPVTVTKCSNDGPGSTSPPLILDGLTQSPNDLTADDLAPGSLRVLDRLTYDVRGLVKRHTMWAEPCGKSVCLIAGIKTAFTRGWLKPHSITPADHSTQLANPDDMVGQDLGQRLIVVYDREDSLQGVSWDSYDGAITWADPIVSEGWRGQLFLVLAPDSELAVVTVHPHEGEARNYQRNAFLD